MISCPLYTLVSFLFMFVALFFLSSPPPRWLRELRYETENTQLLNEAAFDLLSQPIDSTTAFLGAALSPSSLYRYIRDKKSGRTPTLCINNSYDNANHPLTRPSVRPSHRDRSFLFFTKALEEEEEKKDRARERERETPWIPINTHTHAHEHADGS
jgi:hypothetical protein